MNKRTFRVFIISLIWTIIALSMVALGFIGMYYLMGS